MLTCKEIDNLLESFVDGELTLDLSQDVRDHVAACPECRVKLELARYIADELHSLPRRACPDTFVQNVLAQVQPKRKTIRGWLRFPVSQLRPRYAFGLSFVAITLVAIISLTVYRPHLLFKDEQPQYTEEQIAQAKREIHMALGYVNYATSRTQQIIENDVVPQKVIRPIQKSLEAIHMSKEKGDSS